MRSLVVKFGTECLLDRVGQLSQSFFRNAASQIAQVIKDGTYVTIVSSGAIQTGRLIVSSMSIDEEMFSGQALAGIGSAKLVLEWQQAFERHGITVAQFPVTYANFECVQERDSILSNVFCYHRSKVVVPTFNVNDVATKIEVDAMEAGLSENDRLARVVADLIGADGVIFITSVGWVYDRDPKTDFTAKRYRELDIQNLASIQAEGKSSRGSGGMSNKLLESIKCCQPDRRVCIANIQDNTIVRFASGQSVGTLLGSENRFYAWPS